MHVVALSGSPSSTSINLQLLRAALALLPEGAASEIVSVSALDAPFYSPDLERESGVPASVARLHAAIQRADAVILASPEYNGSMPAVLKNAIDWLSRVDRTARWLAKPVALLSASPGPNGGATNLGNLAKLAPWWGADVVGAFSLGRFSQRFDAAVPAVSEPESARALAALIEALVARVGAEAAR